MASRVEPNPLIYSGDGEATLRLDDALWPRPYRVELRTWAPGLDQLVITSDEASPEKIRDAEQLRSKKDLWCSVEWANGRSSRGPGRVSSLTIEGSAYRLVIIVGTERTRSGN